MINLIIIHSDISLLTSELENLGFIHKPRITKNTTIGFILERVDGEKTYQPFSILKNLPNCEAYYEIDIKKELVDLLIKNSLIKADT